MGGEAQSVRRRQSVRLCTLPCPALPCPATPRCPPKTIAAPPSVPSETYGEDPFLTGQLAQAFVKGLQVWSAPALFCCKSLSERRRVGVAKGAGLHAALELRPTLVSTADHQTSLPG